MKIIKRGNVPKETVYRAICCDCTSLLEFGTSDLKVAGSQYNERIYSFVCPVCGEKKYIYENDLPSYEKKEGG